MDKEYYLEKLLFILEHRLKIKKDLLVEENYDVMLTGYLFRLTELELLYIFLEMEREIGFRINTDSIEPYQFNSINGIIGLIEKSCNLIRKDKLKMEAQ